MFVVPGIDAASTHRWTRIDRSAHIALASRSIGALLGGCTRCCAPLFTHFALTAQRLKPWGKAAHTHTLAHPLWPETFAFTFTTVQDMASRSPHCHHPLKLTLVQTVLRLYYYIGSGLFVLEGPVFRYNRVFTHPRGGNHFEWVESFGVCFQRA